MHFIGSNVRQASVPAPAAFLVVLSNLGFWLTFRGGLTECDVSGVWWDGRTLLP